MPTSKLLVLLVLLMICMMSTTLQRVSTQTDQVSVPFAPTLQSGLNSALQWLAANESSNGSYGAYTPHWASAATYALWLNNTHSEKAKLSSSWLASQLNDSSSFFWGTYGEADIPGAVLYSLASSSNLNLINLTFVRSSLMQFQQPNGGFEGYSYCSSACTTAYPVYITVTSSVDTDMALLGLINSNLIPAQNQTRAVQYLLSLQNSDGSFNLTSSVRYAQIYSLGPDPTSITADSVLALQTAGFTAVSPPVSKALEFLRTAVSDSFGGPGHVYSAATSAIALKAYDQADSAIGAIVYIIAQQNSDGGFSDLSRSSFYPRSNALDTGWAAIALETKTFEEGTFAAINSPPEATFSLNPQAPTSGVPIHFDASSSHDLDGDQLFYTWTFGDGSSAVGVNPTHIYTTSGSFTVTLTVTDSGANPGPLSNTKAVNITVQPTTVQGTSTLPFEGQRPWIIVGGIALVAIIGIAIFVERRSRGRPTV